MSQSRSTKYYIYCQKLNNEALNVNKLSKVLYVITLKGLFYSGVNHRYNKCQRLLK